MKIGIVGHGSIGKRHADNARTLGHEVKIYDPKELFKDFRRERDLYEWADAVVVATPSPYHESCIRAAIERDKPVLVEKPISTSIGMLPVLLGHAKRPIMMGNNLRFHPCVAQAKNWLEQNHIGKVLWAQFTCATESVKPLYLSDGVILNTGSHEVDMAMYLLGPVKNVICASVGHILRPGTADSDVNVYLTDDIVDFVLQHESGCRSSFHLDFVTPNRIREFWIAGSENNIGVDLDRRRIGLGEHATSKNGSYDDDYVEEMKRFVAVAGMGIMASAEAAMGTDGLATLEVLLEVRKKAGLV